MADKQLGYFGGKISPAQAYGVLAATVFLWAVGVVIVRAVHGKIPLVGLSYWRWTLASLVLFPFVRKELKEKSQAVRGGLKLLVWQGILIVGSGSLFYYALNFTMVINATLINATQPVVTVLLAWMLMEERLRGIQLLGVASALCGVGIMVSKGSWSVVASFDFNTGDLLVLLATVGYAVYAINIRRMPKNLGTFPALLVIMSAGSVFLLPFYIAETIYLKPFPFTLPSIGIAAILAVFLSILPIGMWNFANGVVGPNRAGVFVNLIPVYGALLAILFLGEKLYRYHVSGAALVCAGILLVVRQQQYRHKK
ncbi:MAG: DMT family transporter [Desulfobacterales bacterium]|nr:DMT family transporter [Desulfobacterales bacterium]